MSAIFKLIPEGETDPDIKRLPDVLSHYKRKMKNWKADLAIKNKPLGQALSEHHSIAAYYDEIKVEVTTLTNYMQIKLDQRVGEINEIIKEHSKFDHSDRSVDKLIGKDEKYIQYACLKLEIDELHKKISFICKQFEQRTYTLGHITKVHIASLQDSMI